MPRIILILFLCAALPAIAQDKLSYSFRMDTSSSSLLVQLKCRGSATGTTVFKLPDSWANQSRLFRAVTAVSAPGALSMQRLEDSVSMIIVHQPGKEITIQYRLQQDWLGKLDYPLNYRAIIKNNFIQLTGYALFILPEVKKEKIVEINFDWSGMPVNWTIGNSLHSGTSKYTGKISAGDLQNSFYVAGDFRLHKRLVEGKPVYIAIRGNEWKFEDSELVNSAQAIIYANRKFWNEFSDPYYFISLVPFDGSGSYNGSALHQSFLMGMSGEFNVDSYIYKLLAHEYFHKWVGVHIIMKGDEQQNAWFGEGFTEYYTHKLLYKSGLLNYSEFIHFVNATIADYYLSPVKNAGIVEMGKNFWTGRNYQQLPYKKGFTYALFLDEMIIKGSSGKYSLDDVLFALNASARVKKDITEKMFTDLVQNFSGVTIEELHRKFIHDGGMIPVLPLLLGKEVNVEKIPMGAFELGFDIDASSQKKILEGVVENGAAYKAGLRNGQKLVGWSIQYDNISTPAEITIKTDTKGLQKISYLPMKEEKIAVPQIIIAN